ncbi:MAG: hypothetical protein IPK76_24785 [Lewinellaceae bacterium]|nr:hypothetical protein [Lewinellaceae bacterium]
MAVAETPLSPEQVAVLICPALTESRYRAERFTPPAGFFAAGASGILYGNNGIARTGATTATG